MKNKNYNYLREIRCRVCNLIYVLNSNDIPRLARDDISLTCAYSILSTINQLFDYHEQKNCKN